MELKAGEFKLIPLGIAMELPRGYEAHIVPRSSTFKNFGIIQTNHMGVVDESYCGDNDQWFFPAYALRDTQIRMNDRICQFLSLIHIQMCIRDSCTAPCGGKIWDILSTSTTNGAATSRR